MSSWEIFDALPDFISEQNRGFWYYNPILHNLGRLCGSTSDGADQIELRCRLILAERNLFLPIVALFSKLLDVVKPARFYPLIAVDGKCARGASFFVS